MFRLLSILGQCWVCLSGKRHPKLKFIRESHRYLRAMPFSEYSRVQIVAFVNMYNYDAFPTCNTKVDTVARTKHCRKHGDLEHTKPSGFVKLEIANGTGQQTVTILSRRIRELCKFEIEEFVNY